MFDSFFGWRKVSKCKKLIKRVQCRLKLLKNKRHAIARHLREDVVQLIKSGYEDSAFNRIEQLIIDESIVEVYELLDHFCEYIIVNFSYIRKHRDCPNDISEAVSSLIYASPRFGDLPELIVIRELFRERYGQKFATTAVELLPGNLVNFQIKEKLSMTAIHDDVKYRVLHEIVRDYCLGPELLALEYYPEWQELKEKENAVSKPRSADFEAKGEVVCVDSARQKLLNGPCDSFSQQGPHLTNVSAEAEDARKLAMINSSYNFAEYALEDREEKVVPSADSLAWFPKGAIVYFDDIEEVQSKDGGLQDQRQVKFRSYTSHEDEEFESGCDEDNVAYNELSSEISSTRSLTKRRKLHGSKRRSTTLRFQCTKDVGCMIYYYKPCQKHQKLIGNSQLICGEDGRKQFRSSKMGSNCGLCQCIHDKRHCSNTKARECSLDHPFFSSICDDKEHSLKHSREMRTLVDLTAQVQHEMLLAKCYHCSFGNLEPDEGSDSVALPKQWQARDNENSDVVGKVLTYSDYQSEKQNTESKEKIACCVGSSLPSDTCTAGGIASSARKEIHAPYSRAMTMPPERPKESQKDNISRTNSCPAPYLSHVHPKLPEYDDITAKFMALKKAHQQSNQQVTQECR